MNEIGKQIKSIRSMKLMTQVELAEEIGISDKYLSKIETGVSAPGIEIYIKIANKLGVSLDFLVGNNLEVKEKIKAQMLAMKASRLSEEYQDFLIKIADELIEIENKMQNR